MALGAAVLTASLEASPHSTEAPAAPLAVVPSPQTASWWMPRHEARLAAVKALRDAGKSPRVVFIGDSITEWWERAGQPVWAEHYAGLDALNLGFAGDKTDQVLWRLQQGEVNGLAPRVAVLMIGTNNTGDRRDDPAATALGVRRVIEELQQRLPTTTVLLLAIFPRGATADDSLRAINTRINTRLSALADGKRVHFLDVGPALTNADGSVSPEVMPDQLHLSERGYRLWAQAMQPTLTRLLEAPR